ncbi:uncharacterized protein LOC115629174 isoform X1 [Scaptodrosophila lebanonensis]|uniref:Uncharacterized protein LOC115629174 isoform X1 n=1 Tax=Drosophila lebanonensis TaxID=7225 RepID=A0A6J2U1Q5_DROLE|nr:uncharacterized protein LOC115629174 isoform X1 [Scaptodrosophila lebanonensis]
MAKVSFRQQKRMRNVSQKLRDTQTAYIMYYHRNYVRKLKRLEAKAEANGGKDVDVDVKRMKSVLSLLHILDQATSFYVSAGYYSQFANNLLPFHAKLEMGQEGIEVLRSHRFIDHFYDEFERVPSTFSDKETTVMHLRLIYTVTLLNLLRKFRYFRILRFENSIMHFKIALEVKDAFIGVIFESMTARQFSSRRGLRVAFISIVNQLLEQEQLYYGVNGSYQYVAKMNGIFHYGLERTRARRCTRLNLIFSVLAPRSVCHLLRDAIHGLVDPDKPIPLLNTAVFNVRLDVKSVRSLECVEDQDYHLNIT